MLWALFINFRLFLFAGSNVFKLYYEAVVRCGLCLSKYQIQLLVDDILFMSRKIKKVTGFDLT